MDGQIIAAGGIGLSNGLKHSAAYALEEYIVDHAAHLSSVCFVPTASGEDKEYIISFYKTFSRFKCALNHLSLFRPPSDMRSFIMQQSIIIIGGGNTKSMLALWKEWGLDLFFHEYWMNGGLLAGSSAGALCWFEEGTTDSIPGTLTSLKGLGFLKGSLSPHFDDEPERKPTYQRMINQGILKPGIGLDKHAALHYRATELVNIISLKQGAAAYQVKKDQTFILSI